MTASSRLGFGPSFFVNLEHFFHFDSLTQKLLAFSLTDEASKIKVKERYSIF